MYVPIISQKNKLLLKHLDLLDQKTTFRQINIMGKDIEIGSWRS